MESLSVARLRQQAELLVALSILHLTSETRTALADDNLSVNAYPTGCGGFVYVGVGASANVLSFGRFQNAEGFAAALT